MPADLGYVVFCGFKQYQHLRDSASHVAKGGDAVIHFVNIIKALGTVASHVTNVDGCLWRAISRGTRH